MSEHFLTVVCSEETFQYCHSETTLTTYAQGGGEIFFSGDATLDTLKEVQEKLQAEGVVSRIVWEAEREQPYGTTKSIEKRRRLWISAKAPHKVKHHQGGRFEDFIYCILEDEEPYITAMDGYRSAEVTCAVKESAKKG
ncbi:MAG: hypothetical protein DRJ47_10025 [Thermoprotei archaeon]|nr:MAG: hypothetical protein DRJ47_10025 [Thermoprotei archaeon]